LTENTPASTWATIITPNKGQWFLQRLIISKEVIAVKAPAGIALLVLKKVRGIFGL
jgi:hypothetical protein